MEYRLTSAAFLLVAATYLFLGGIGVTDPGNPFPRDADYNLLARGLMSGHLSLDKQAPAALARLSDPYDPAANKVFRSDSRYRLHDITYYRGRLYLYFGAAPALLLFIPWHLVTGAWLPHWVAVVVLCAGGLLVNLSLVRAIGRRLLPDSPPWVSGACVLVLGLGSYVPLLLGRADMWEIPIAFNYAFVSLALRFLWWAYEDPARSAWRIAAASAALGLAFAARPTVLPNAAILATPFFFREVRASAGAWVAAVAPLSLCGVLVGLYNALRFGSPFEFGQHYQLSGDYEGRMKHFSPAYLATNLHLYLFKSVDWLPFFPYAHEPAKGSLPPNHGDVEHISGALLNSPILWAALLVPAFVVIRRPAKSFFLVAVSAAWVAVSSLLLMSFFFGTCCRYQSEFVPALSLLAALGVMAGESLLRGRLRTLAACALVPALIYSCVFPVLYAIDRDVTNHTDYGMGCLLYGNIPGAERELGIASFLSPGNRISRLGNGVVLVALNRPREAEPIFEGLVRDFPDYGTAHYNLARILAGEGRFGEAVAEFRTALRLEPGNRGMQAGLDAALAGARGARP